MTTVTRARAGISGGSRFLDPAVLSRIDNLELLARTVVDGFLSGLHRSPYLGFSMDFAEHRPYMPGDDVRRIDWKLFGRTDRHYIKLFEAETNANFTVLLDVSRSMRYGGGVSKLDYARYLAASLTYFCHRQRDRVGLVAFDRDVVEYVPPSMKHLDTVLHVLDRLDAEGDGELAPPLLRAAELLRRRGIVALVSDLYEEPDAVLSAVTPLAARGHDVVVFHVLDPHELDFPFTEAATFQDLESGEQVPVIPARLAQEYREMVAAHTASLEERLVGRGIDYVLLNTSHPLDHALFRYLTVRERAGRVR